MHFIHMCISICVSTCTYACVSECVWVCVQVYVCECVLQGRSSKSKGFGSPLKQPASGWGQCRILALGEGLRLAPQQYRCVAREPGWPWEGIPVGAFISECLVSRIGEIVSFSVRSQTVWFSRSHHVWVLFRVRLWFGCGICWGNRNGAGRTFRRPVQEVRGGWGCWYAGRVNTHKQGYNTNALGRQLASAILTHLFQHSTIY